MTVRIRVDHDACTGHARCHTVDPDLFTLDDVGYSAVDVADVPTGAEERARLAVASCPEQAITIEEV